MSPKEHAARAMLMGRVYDMYTCSYRLVSPEGSKYKYLGALDADTLEELADGVVRTREVNFRHLVTSYRHEEVKGIANTVSRKRAGLE